MNTQRILENIGLDEKEAKIYLALLKVGRASAAEVAKETHMKRTTVYPYLDSLKAKGLVEWGVEKYNRKVKARNPKQLLRFAKAQDRKYGRAVLELESSLDEIKKSYSEDLTSVNVKYFEGVSQCRKLLEELYKIEGDLYSYSSWMKHPVLGEDWCKEFNKKLYRKKGMKNEFEIVSGSQHNLFHAKEYVKGPTYNQRYFFRFIPKKEQLINVDVYLFNDKKIVLSYKNVKPNGILIVNKDLVQSEIAIFRELFEKVGLQFEDYLDKYGIKKEDLKHVEND